jgi:elongator complex protein 3
LHVYGQAVALKGKGDVQHMGLGLNLLKEAETIAKEQGREKMVIISGVGVRQYYAKQGYSRLGPYMAKEL